MVANPRRTAKRTPARRRKGTPAQDARVARREKRRAAILDAALEEFAARGFAATRLDDVARRARIAKGTIYLYFRDKESLFQELVRTMLSPLVGAIEATPRVDVPVRVVADPEVSAGQAAIDIILRSGPIVRVRPGFDAVTLAQAIAVLEGREC